jgi:lipopolysaccharide/colanic/teichoic acid biosynthesis glycosyltransferase
MLYEPIKRIIDIVSAILALILLSPLLLLVAIIIKLESEGPLIYAPSRVGRGGRLFRMYKFRSMKMYKIDGELTHAEEYLKTKPKLWQEYRRNSYKLANDPRLTRIGSFLRKSSIDELPQLVNILRGEMSLVGPRAYMPDELDDQQKVYPKTKPLVKTLLLAKPGLTGYWQVSGRANINFDKRIEMDAEYVKKRSLLYDFELMLRTIPALFTAKGAV